MRYRILTLILCPLLLACPGPATQDAPAVRATPTVAATSPGQQLFEAQCAVCHQKDGYGVAESFPPLAGSEWVTADPEVIVNIVLFGVEGEMTVRGEPYIGQMPEFSALTDEELASILSYVRSSFGNQASPVEPALIASVRGQRQDFWTGEEELREVLGDKAPPVEPD